MPELLGQGSGAQTSDGYSPACTLGPATGVRQLFFQVLNADAVVRYWKLQPDNPNAGPVAELLERRVTQGSLVTVANVAGAEFRSATPSDPATILGELDYATDPLPAFQQVTQVTLTLTILKDGVPVGSETALDFEDSSTVTWQAVDTPGSKVAVTATVIGAPPTGAAGGDLNGTYPNPTVDGLQGRAVSSSAPGTNQALVWGGASWGPAAVANSVFGRTGAVVATSGDYTAAQVTNAADKSSASSQNFTGNVTAPLFQVITTGAAIAFETSQSGDTNNRVTVSSQPALGMGPGNAAIDTSLTRAGVGLFAQTSTPATADNSTKLATTAYVQAQGYVTAATAPVTSVFTRTGAVVANTGDYTAAQVTNAADKSSASAQVFTGVVSTGPTAFSLPSSVTGAFLSGNALNVQAVTGTNVLLIARANNTDTVATVAVTSDGQVTWGPGTAARDATLERSAANTLRLTNTGIVSTSPSIGVGYATGAGGTVTQITSRGTGVTLNTITGQITLATVAPAIGTWVTFTVTNSRVAATDGVLVWVVSGTNTYTYLVTSVAAGSFKLTGTSVSGTTADAPVLGFAIIKAANS